MADRNPTTSRITLVSTHTVDRIPGPNGASREIAGGPAHYIGKALERLGCPWRLITGEMARVEVLFGPQGEDYIIPSLPRIQLPPRFATQAVILSPIMQEIDPQAVPPVDGMLVADLQGFVREPLTPFYRVRRTFSLERLLRRAALVKAHEAELERLDHPSRRALADTLLVITRGADGVLLRRGGEEEQVQVSAVEAAETIGAGDTFLAAMVVGLLDGQTPRDSAERAAQFVAEMLRERGAAADNKGTSA